MTTPVWGAATSGQPPLAAQINQFLISHTSQNLYAATLQSSQTTNGTAHTNSNGQYMAQSFTTGVSQTAVGYVVLPLGSFVSSGSTLGTITLSLYANSSGAPTGSALVTTTIATEYPFAVTAGVDTVNVTYPLPITGLTPSTTYWLVTSPAGNVTNHYTWRQSNQVSGASTSTNGTTWTAQSYGLQYAVYDQSATGPLTCTWDDSGVRWTWRGYNTNLQLTNIAEFTTGQTASGYQQSYRSLSYNSAYVSGVS